MFLLLFAIIGEIFSIMTCLYISYFGTPDEIFTNYENCEDNVGLYMFALFCGWAMFPFYGYVLYKQIQYNNKHK